MTITEEMIKILEQMGYENLTCEFGDIRGMISKDGDSVRITCGTNVDNFYNLIFYTYIYGKFDNHMYGSTHDYNNAFDKRRVVKNFKQAVRKYLLSPNEVLVKDIIQ